MPSLKRRRNKQPRILFLAALLPPLVTFIAYTRTLRVFIYRSEHLHMITYFCTVKILKLYIKFICSNLFSKINNNPLLFMFVFKTMQIVKHVTDTLPLSRLHSLFFLARLWRVSLLLFLRRSRTFLLSRITRGLIKFIIIIGIPVLCRSEGGAAIRVKSLLSFAC